MHDNEKTKENIEMKSNEPLQKEKNLVKEEKGFMVVEMIGSFMIFLFLMVSILSLINIATTQARVHYALTQAANTVSTYSYILDITGVSDVLKNSAEASATVSAEGEKIATQIETLLGDEGLGGLSSGVSGLDTVYSQGEALASTVYSDAESIISDPKAALSLFLNCAVDEGQKAVFEQLVRPLVGRYLANGDMSGDEYLQSVNVIGGLDGIDFYDLELSNFTTTTSDDSTLIDSDENLKIVAKYTIEYKFGALPLPFDSGIEVTEVVKTKLWLDGRG